MESNVRKYRKIYFSLMEIVIAVTILALAAGIAAPMFMRHFDKARVNAAKAQLSNLKLAINDFYLDTNKYPSSLDELLTNNGNPKWQGPYLEAKQIPKDPWGNDYILEQVDGKCVIITYGKDGSQGGSSYAADLRSDELAN